MLWFIGHKFSVALNRRPLLLALFGRQSNNGFDREKTTSR